MTAGVDSLAGLFIRLYPIRRNRYESMGDTIVQLRDAYCSGSMRSGRLKLQTADAHCRLYSTGFHD